MNVEIYNRDLCESDVLKRIQDLESEVIIYNHDPEGEFKNNEKVVKIYFDFIKDYKKIPSVTEILDSVYSHNEEIFNEIAKLNVMIDPNRNFDEILDSIEDYYNYYSSYYDLGAYIEEILLGNNLCFYYDEDSDIYYHIEDPKITIVANDCQNTLMHKIELEDEFLWGGCNYEENVRKFRAMYM